MRVLVFHGYLLSGTGSNVYTAELVQALARAGHEVHVCCQDLAAGELPWVSAVGDWSDGGLTVRTLRPGAVTAYRPPIGRTLPVYVADRYEGFDARTFADLDDHEIEAYVAANVRAVADIAAGARPDVALAGHLVMGPAILARALAGAVPYAVKIHGSALEYTVKPDPERFGPWAREGLAGARSVLVGSGHTARSLWAAFPDVDGLRERTWLGPPGVDVERFTPRDHDDARERLVDLRRRLTEAGGATATPGGDAAGSGPDDFSLDAAKAAAALAAVEAGDELVTYVGKLIPAKGVDLLLAAWPLVLDRVPSARLLVVGFGSGRGALEDLAGALAAGDPARAAGWATHPEARRFMAGAPDGYAAAALRGRIGFTGALDHTALGSLLPAAAVQVVPSVFPEAYGMVAAEAAACGVLPVSAGHSGLAEVTAELETAIPELEGRLSFGLDADPVRVLADRITGWLQTPGEERERLRAALAAHARARFSWDGVARTVLDAAGGDPADLRRP